MRPSLALVIQHCERWLGNTWYFNPQRWETSDGYAPWAVVWVAWRGLQATHAFDRLSMTRAITTAVTSGDAGTMARHDELHDAFPESEP